MSTRDLWTQSHVREFRTATTLTSKKTDQTVYVNGDCD